MIRYHTKYIYIYYIHSMLSLYKVIRQSNRKLFKIKVRLLAETFAYITNLKVGFLSWATMISYLFLKCINQIQTKAIKRNLMVNTW